MEATILNVLAIMSGIYIIYILACIIKFYYDTKRAIDESVEALLKYCHRE